MRIEPELVAAVAAVLAAILSATTLAITGRREERRWRREALTEALVMFLDSSFKGVSQGTMRKRDGGQDISHLEQSAVDSHAEMVRSTTRLRMLAGNGVVNKAEELHTVLDEMYNSVFKTQPILEKTQATEAAELLSDLAIKRDRLRNEFVALARQNLGLGGDSPKYDSQSRRGPSLREVSKNVPEFRIQLLKRRDIAD